MSSISRVTVYKTLVIVFNQLCLLFFLYINKKFFLDIRSSYFSSNCKTRPCYPHNMHTAPVDKVNCIQTLSVTADVVIGKQ